ncbi:MAG: DMT family transporter [Bacteroidales bacterium]|nr:DMT family transporter [Bacteroidales bacterium]
MYKGVLLLVSAEFSFALATVFVKFITSNSDIPPIEITFFRVLIGTFVTLVYMVRTNASFRPKRPVLVFVRALFSLAALIAFFYAVEKTSVTKANMLNMTYPVFIFILAPLFRIQKAHKSAVIFLISAMAGITLVMNPDFSRIQTGDLIGLLSGILAAFAIIALSFARLYDSTVLIVFYLMVLGTVCNGLIMIPFFVMPQDSEFVLLIASGVSGVAGQVFLTMGYKYVNARTGSMISSSRILFSALLGVLFFSDKLSWHIITGGIMIMTAIIGISALQKRNQEPQFRSQ